MKTFHLNCGTLASTRQVQKSLVTHCVLLAFDSLLVLIDTGFGLKDVASPSRIPLGFRCLVKPALRQAETAYEQIKGLGFDPEKVHHIFLTHLDLDHTGGLADFPKAQIHVISAELDRALHPKHASERRRYVAAHFSHAPLWQRHEFSSKSWAGILRSDSVIETPVEIFFVSLPGHTENHAGVVVKKPDGNYLMHAGDSYFCRSELETPPRRPFGFGLVQYLLAINRKSWKISRQHLRRLKDNTHIAFFCSHDPREMIS